MRGRPPPSRPSPRGVRDQRELNMEPTASDGDRYEQFTGLLARHHAPLLSFILSLLPHWADAEDILQQASVVMWRKFGDFQEGTSFLSGQSICCRYQFSKYWNGKITY